MTFQFSLWPHGHHCECNDCVLLICKRIAARWKVTLEEAEHRLNQLRDNRFSAWRFDSHGRPKQGKEQTP